MWGIEFIKVDNGEPIQWVDFECQEQDGKTKRRYMVMFGSPDYWSISEIFSDGSDTVIKEMASAEDLVSLLPHRPTWHQWTYGEFVIAMTFFQQGHKDGHR